MQPIIHHLQNDFLTVSINEKGAELSSLKSDSIEYIWQADAAFWGRHAPILFPIVGRLVDHEFEYQNQYYSMGQHGFARDMVFELIQKTDNSLLFQLVASDKTKVAYPFEFILQVKYTLTKRTLTTEYIVENPSKSGDLYFSIGAHPAFNCPLEKGHQRSEYELIFDKSITPDALLHEDGLYNGGLARVLNEDGNMDLPNTVFDNDSLTFSPNPFDQVILQHKLSQKQYLRVAFQGFPFLAIWSKSNTSPFICIEPWYGIADSKSHNKDFTKKEGIEKLGPLGVFNCSFDIEVLASSFN